MLFSGGCRDKSSPREVLGEINDTLTHDAELLVLVDCGSYTTVAIENPWRRGELLQNYVLVSRDSALPENLPEGVLVRVPLTSSLVYSSVHAGVIKELGALDAVTGVADAKYFKIPEIVAGLQSGKIMDVGEAISPSVEKIVDLDAQAILTSPFQNAGHGAIEKTGVPIIECADYMETTPLGRAEWVKLIGELYGCRDKAAELYEKVKINYLRLKAMSENTDTRPKVISETVTGGVWFLPGGKSYMACLFADAAGAYPWSDDVSAGSLQLDFSAVYDKAYDADIWLVKTYGSDLTLSELKSAYPLNDKIKAFNCGGVYASNTEKSSFYEEFPFHPDMLLREYINIFHPGLLTGDEAELRYYKQIKN